MSASASSPRPVSGHSTLASGPSRPAIPDILEEHLEEVAFLSIQRRALQFDHETTLEELAEHDSRITAHREGLRIGGAVSVEIARERLEDPASDWELAAAARVWIEDGGPTPEEVREAIESSGVEAVGGWREAFRGLAPEIVETILPAMWVDSDGTPCSRGVAADARGWIGRHTDRAARVLARDPEAAVRRGIARTLPLLSLETLAPADLLRELTDDPDPTVARAALWSWCLVDREPALARVRAGAAVADPDPFAVRALGWLGDPDSEADRRILAAAAAVDPEEAAADAEEPSAEPDSPTDPVDPTDPSQESTESRWRRSVRAASPGDARWWREIPDGFLGDASDEESQAGA